MKQTCIFSGKYEYQNINVMNHPLFLLQGVVTAATSLITTLAQKNPEEFKTSVSLAVSRLSRVTLFELYFQMPDLSLLGTMCLIFIKSLLHKIYFSGHLANIGASSPY